MKVGIIPCNNGLGHITRSVELANFLIKRFNVTLFLSKNTKNISINKKVSVTKISSNFKLTKNYTYNTNWYKKIKIKKLHKIDLLISDNLPEAVFLKKNTILYANFFWHEILNRKRDLIRNLNKEIIERDIKILSNYLFGNILSLRENIYKIGFIGEFKNQNIIKKKGILISLGNSRVGYNKNFRISLKILQNPKYDKYTFYVDKNLFKKKKKFPKNIKVANFSDKMFEDVKIAIIKPGFGTIQDCLKRGIAINSYLQTYNKEFLNNAKTLKKEKIGDYFFNISHAINDAVNKFNDNKRILKIQNICKKLKWKGEKNFQKYILREIINL